MRRIRDSFVSAGAASISLAVAVGPNESCATPVHAGDAGAADGGGAIGSDAGTEPGDASALDASSPGATSLDSSSPDATSSASASDGAAPSSGGAPHCLSQWRQPAGIQVTATFIATDATGNAYVVLDYDNGQPPQNADAGAPPVFNLGAPSSRVLTGFAVAKFDDGCNLVWVHEFGPQVAATMFASYATAVASDAQGNVTIAGTFEGTADFGAGAVTAVSTRADGILLRLDPSGATVFARHFVNARTDATMGTFGLVVTPAGVSTIAVEANTDTDFGSGQEASLLGPSADYEIVQFDGAGKVLFREAVPSINPSIATITQIATNASGFLWTYGTEPDPFGSGSGVVPDPLLVGLTASGADAWQQQPMVTLSAHPPIWIAAGPAGAVVFTRQDDSPSPGETLQGIAADGSSAWTTSTAVTSSAGGTSIVVDGRSAPVVLGTFTGSATIGSAPPLTSAGGADVVYQIFDSTGHLVSVGSWGTPDDEKYSSLGVDSSGNIFIATTSADPTTLDTVSVSFMKFAR